jgi:hypothetical protein
MESDRQKWNQKYWWIAKQEKDAQEKQLALQASSQSKLNNMVIN